MYFNFCLRVNTRTQRASKGVPISGGELKVSYKTFALAQPIGVSSQRLKNRHLVCYLPESGTKPSAPTDVQPRLLVN
jgi:hypothetical protein